MLIIESSPSSSTHTHTIHLSPFNHYPPPSAPFRQCPTGKISHVSTPICRGPFTSDGSVYDTPEDVRHTHKSRENCRANATRLMDQTRIMAPRNSCGAEIPQSSVSHNLLPSLPHSHVVFVTYCSQHHFILFNPAFPMGLLPPNFRSHFYSIHPRVTRSHLYREVRMMDVILLLFPIEAACVYCSFLNEKMI